MFFLYLLFCFTSCILYFVSADKLWTSKPYYESVNTDEKFPSDIDLIVYLNYVEAAFLQPYGCEALYSSGMCHVEHTVAPECKESQVKLCKQDPDAFFKNSVTPKKIDILPQPTPDQMSHCKAVLDRYGCNPPVRFLEPAVLYSFCSSLYQTSCVDCKKLTDKKLLSKSYSGVTLQQYLDVNHSLCCAATTPYNCVHPEPPVTTTPEPETKTGTTETKTGTTETKTGTTETKTGTTETKTETTEPETTSTTKPETTSTTEPETTSTTEPETTSTTKPETTSTTERTPPTLPPIVTTRTPRPTTTPPWD